MHSPVLMTLGISVGLVVGLSVRGPQNVGPKPSWPTDAAFRDGLFQATVDVQTGRKPHLSSGRWNTNQDRALFIAGYQQGYRETLEGHPGKLPMPTAADVAGYWDGMLDGAADHAGSHSFGPERTTNYLKAGQNLSRVAEDPGRFEREYHHAYLNGYQQGYFSQAASPVLGYYPRDEREPRSARGAPCSAESAPVSR